MAVRDFPPPSFLLPLLLLLLLVTSAHGYGYGRLRVGYYKESCPDVEAVVRRLVAEVSAEDPTVNAPLLRLHFHDCFVRVCTKFDFLACILFTMRLFLHCHLISEVKTLE